CLPVLGYAAPPAKFFEAHCLSCHDTSNKQGGLDLSALKFTATDPNNLAKWVKVHDRIASGEMPPKKKPRPPAADVATALKNLHGHLVPAEGGPDGAGRPRLRR